jgi:hypothetical protein
MTVRIPPGALGRVTTVGTAGDHGLAHLAPVFLTSRPVLADLFSRLAFRFARHPVSLPSALSPTVFLVRAQEE